jgi:hypothetical protein
MQTPHPRPIRQRVTLYDALPIHRRNDIEAGVHRERKARDLRCMCRSPEWPCRACGGLFGRETEVVHGDAAGAGRK